MRTIAAPHQFGKRLPQVATEMALHVLAYNLTRVQNGLASKKWRVFLG